VKLPENSPGVTETILVVEDEVLIRMTVSEYLRDCGYRVLEAANSDEALVILQKEDIQVDVILTGIDMPGSMRGFELSQWARTLRPGLEVILAGTMERAAEAAAELCEDNPLVTKPYDPQLVVDRIKQLLAARKRERRLSLEVIGRAARANHQFSCNRRHSETFPEMGSRWSLGGSLVRLAVSSMGILRKINTYYQ
jgi:CheY-like chemotaxis protein